MAMPRRARNRSAIVLGLILAAVGGAAWGGLGVWSEYAAYRRDRERLEANAVVGYVEVYPRVSFAGRPRNWRHQRDGHTWLWAGWERDEHAWFRLPVGQIDDLMLEYYHNGKDVVRAIDAPLLEVGGGERWRRMTGPTPLVTLARDGGRRAYPLKVMEKVEVINDTLADEPVLITYAPFAPTEERLRVYDPRVGGRRLRMGLSGYFLRKQHLLFDRGTESLWVRDGDRLCAIAGKLRGVELPPSVATSVTTWRRWLAANPEGELVVGADREAEASAAQGAPDGRGIGP